MKTVKILAILLAAAFAAGHLRAENYYFRNLSIDQGLPQTTVNTILQDRKGFMWFGTKYGLCRYDGATFRDFKREKDNPHKLVNNFITALYEDSEGRIWVGTDAGLYIFNPESETFASISEIAPGSAPVEHTVTSIAGDSDGHVWIAVEEEGLYCYDGATGKLKANPLKDFKANVQSFAIDSTGRIWVGFYGAGLHYSTDGLKTLKPYLSPSTGREVFKDDVVMSIVNGAYNCLFISSQHNGVQQLNLTSGQLDTLLLRDESGEKVFGRDLLVRADGELWIGSESGIYIYNLGRGNYRHLQSSSDDPYSLSDNAVYSLYEDREGGIWTGTYFGGVDYLPKSGAHFVKYYPDGRQDGLRGRRVREFCRDRAGHIWVGTEDAGLHRFDPSTGKITFFAPSEAFTNIQGLSLIDGKLWVGTFSKGLKVIDPATGKIEKSYMHGTDPNSLIDNSIFAICRTTTGDVLLGTMFGLLRYNPDTDGFDRIEEMDGKFIYDICEASNGNLWLATYANGAYCFDVNSRTWKNYTHSDGDPSSLASNKVLSVFEDSKGRVWLTTQGGGCSRFIPASGTFDTYGSDDLVYQIVEDKKGTFWLTTNAGLVKFDPDARTSRRFTTDNGLLSNQFNYKSSFRDSDGTIYLGSLEGFLSFNPETLEAAEGASPLAITDFLLFNRRQHPYDPASPLEKSITYSDNITLKSDQNSFSLRLASLGFHVPELDKVVYRLDGFDTDWIPIGESPLVTYSNLGHGKYTFRMKLADAPAGEEYVLRIRILPPFYLSIWAYIIYILLFAAAIILLYRYFKRRNDRARARQRDKFEREKATEIYEAKIQFFTNIAHEVRTPLTLIKGPLENILQNQSLDDDVHEDLSIMRQNTDRLLDLVNQILDFRKVESQGYSLCFTQCDVGQIISTTFNRFRSAARQRGLDFKLTLPPTPVYAQLNCEAFTKILSNLMNNGVKYSETYLHIELTADNERKLIRLTTRNDGALVPSEVRDSIFKPFVRFNEDDNSQAVPGTGIGLALARSLAELHGGTLEMDSETDRNVFILTLPMLHDGAEVDEKCATEPQAEEPEKRPATTAAGAVPEGDAAERRHTVLVVEDSEEMLNFIARLLKPHYTVLTAANGEEALKVLDENFVNLVVSDVMMPVMNGFDLCATIKSNIGYSHIPVVLLTAKTNVQSKIMGMELGADSYIEKPFDPKYLLAVVTNLINGREKLRRDFANSPYTEVTTMALTKADEEFIRKLDELIHSNIANPDFNIDSMADNFNMSRSSFYRKVKGVLDLTPKEYLRIERLKLAAQLLKEGKYRINEICYMVGFSTSSYFTKCFLKQFGVLPKDFS